MVPRSMGDRRALHASRRVLPVLGAVAAGYLAGTIPSADIAARLATSGATDVRAEGSGNPGAMNTMKTVGSGWGYAVLVADIAKGAVAAGVGRRLAGSTGASLGGAAAVVGHCYPIWNGGKGGKGVAASVGQVLVTFPLYAPIDATVAGLTAVAPQSKQRAFAATAIASLTWIGMSTLWWRRGWPTGGAEPTVALPVGAAISSAVIASRFAAR